MDPQVRELTPEMRRFLEDVMEEAEVIIPDPELQEEMLAKMAERLDKLLTIRFVQHFTDEDVDAFIQMNEDGKPYEEVHGFIREKIPKADEIFKDAFLEFKLLYIGHKTKD